MPKRPNDAFGLSLLDVLSNALGATILLMMIVAASLGKGDEKRRNLPVEEGEGENVTVLDFYPEPSRSSLHLLVIQIRLFGDDAEFCSLRIEGEQDSCTIAQGINKRSEWLVTRKGRLERQWFVVLEAQKTLPDSFSVLATSDDQPLVSEVRRLDKNLGQLERTLLSVSEKSDLPPEIQIH
ncbi:MAG: hypothetical protein ILNGONEN_00203 [Syntrophorhabdaceae bacterium]|nr:hypothetical protein [Syntrophorhabdaceae bacterium]